MINAGSNQMNIETILKPSVISKDLPMPSHTPPNILPLIQRLAHEKPIEHGLVIARDFSGLKDGLDYGNNANFGY
jgi:hypothetical protein